MAAEDVAGSVRAGQQVTEQVARFSSGLRMLALGILVLLAGVGLVVAAGHRSGAGATLFYLLGALVLATGALGLRGLTAVVPGQARVVQLFGRYRGTIREPGLQWVNPFTVRIVISTR